MGNRGVNSVYEVHTLRGLGLPSPAWVTAFDPLSKLQSGNLKQLFWDRAGISLSGLCVLHCLLLPVVLAVAPVWTVGETVHAWLHPLFAIILVPTTLVAAVGGFNRHNSWHVITFLAVGLTVIIVAGYLGNDRPGTSLETTVTIVGSALLIAGHVLNWRMGVRMRPTPAVVGQTS